MRIKRTEILAIAVLVIALLIAPVFVGSYWTYILALWAVMAIAVVGLNIPLGLGHIYSFGHGAFVLIGAYGTGVAMTMWHWPFLPALLLSLILAGGIGAIIARPALRLSDFSLAIVTFSFAHMLFHLIKATNYTGGPQGIFMPGDTWIAGKNGLILYYIVMGVAAAAVTGFVSLARSKSGRAMRLAGENPAVAQSLGIRIVHYKSAAIVLSALYGAVAGSFMALLTGYVAPEAYSTMLSVNLFAAVAIGGIGTVTGPLLGALFIVMIPEVTQSFQNLSQIVYAALFCLIVTVFPRGLVGLMAFRFRRPVSRTKDRP